LAPCTFRGLSWWTAEEGPIELHIWSGIAILALLIFRLLWGLFGSSTARFSSFVRGPGAVLAYVRDVRGWRQIGHNPLGALSALALLGLIAVQVGLGLFNTDRDGLSGGPLSHFIGFETSKLVHDLHEDLFDVILIFIGLHVAAIVIYRLVFGKSWSDPWSRAARSLNRASSQCARPDGGSHCFAPWQRSRSHAG
jgi:cytochrome b